MADMDKDRLKELEIESILEETHYLADQERMEQTAQKYRAKPKIEEIFSNADKKPRLKNTNPLDESEPDTSNSIVGDKTVAQQSVGTQNARHNAGRAYNGRK